MKNYMQNVYINLLHHMGKHYKSSDRGLGFHGMKRLKKKCYPRGKVYQRISNMESFKRTY